MCPEVHDPAGEVGLYRAPIVQAGSDCESVAGSVPTAVQLPGGCEIADAFRNAGAEEPDRSRVVLVGMGYRLLADLIVAVHSAYVAFVVIGQALILIGLIRGWR